MKLKPASAYPKVSKDAISVNLESEISILIDKAVFNMYDQSIEKNGELVAYNQVVDFVGNVSKDRKRSLDQLITAEKCFKKGIDFIHEHQRPYLEKQDKDIKKVTSLLKDYLEIQFNNFLDDYESSASELAYMIHYLNSNMEYFDKVTMGNLGESAKEFYKAILEFDRIHILHERSNDLVELVSKKLCVEELKRSDFIRTIEQINSENQLKPGPKTPSKLMDDIEAIIEGQLDSESEMYNPEFFDQNGDLIIIKAVHFAMDYPPFAKRWIDDESAIKTYSKRRLQTLFKKSFKEMKR